MIKVAIIQREIPDYRIRFFEEVYAQGSAIGLDVTVYSAASGSSQPAFNFPHRCLPVVQLKKRKSGSLWMKGLTAALRGTDVVVAPHELQCLNVPYLWARRRRRGHNGTWIWWGHGYNFQAPTNPSLSTSMKEALKHFMTKRSNGLITYSEAGAAFSRARGMSTESVIPYFNTIDVRGLRDIAARIDDQSLLETRLHLGLQGKDVLLFAGRLYPEKQVDFLLTSLHILQSVRSNVALLILGDGAERVRLEALRKLLHLEDVHFLGESMDPLVTSRYFRLADLLVIPGAVGLAIVHGFVFGLPLLTTRDDYHGPEIEYLSIENGIMTSHHEVEYAEAIRSVLASPLRLKSMREAAHASADRLSLESSVWRFLKGIDTLARTPR